MIFDLTDKQLKAAIKWHDIILIIESATRYPLCNVIGHVTSGVTMG